MPGAMCVECNQGFMSASLLAAHVKGGHNPPGAPLENTAPAPPRVTADGLPTPTPEMLAVVERQRQKAEQAQVPQEPTPVAPNKLPDGTVVEPPKPEPIKLTYVYIGVCTTCNKPIKTLELDVDSKHFVTAYCMNCNKQLESRQEKKLDE